MEKGKEIGGFCRVPGGREDTHFTGAGTGPGCRGGIRAPPGAEARPSDSTTLLFHYLDFRFHFLNGKGRRGPRPVACFFEQNHFV